jgi:phospholipid/cholesterol/gamma-HCH transport system substrate-binding protein
MSRVRWWRRYQELPVPELQRSNPVRAGLVLLVVLAIAVYFGFTKHIPYTHGFRLNAVFPSAQNISPRSPVRVAGVDIGQVTSVKREGDAGLVTMEISSGGLPIHSDAMLKIRPRTFLEGNWFVEMSPGTPFAPTVHSGYTIPITQTADPVQLDQVLDALNTDTRANLQTFLAEYGDALTRHPSPEDDAEQNPSVRGLNAAQAFKKAYLDGPPALKGSAIVNQALTGSEQHDLSKLVSSAGRFTAALSANEQALSELIPNFNTFLAAFANQSSSLRATVAELPATLQNAHRAFAGFSAASPAIRAFSLDLVPGVEKLPATITAALPWFEQVTASLGPSELGGVAHGLREGTPSAVAVANASGPLFKQGDALSKCFTNVLFPSFNARLQDGPNTSGVESYKEFFYSLAGLAGVGQNFDGNGLMPRFLLDTGNQTLLSAPVSTVGSSAAGLKLRLLTRVSQTPEGTRPAFPATEPPYKPLVPCYTQKVPDFNGPLSQGPADGSS